LRATRGSRSAARPIRRVRRQCPVRLRQVEAAAAGNDTLDNFLAKIHGLDSQSILLVGYADRMGSRADNQTLSQQRVDAVKSYLVGKGIASERVQTSARGETQPDTRAGGIAK
jgi:outer membrane protein OmpA-like peptidoglycan-associated protein